MLYSEAWQKASLAQNINFGISLSKSALKERWPPTSGKRSIYSRWLLLVYIFRDEGKVPGCGWWRIWVIFHVQGHTKELVCICKCIKDALQFVLREKPDNKKSFWFSSNSCFSRGGHCHQTCPDIFALMPMMLLLLSGMVVFSILIFF